MNIKRSVAYPQAYKQFIAALIAWGIPAENLGVGGGFARDTYFKRPPNDMDIVLVGMPWPDTIGGVSFKDMLPGGWELLATYQRDGEYAAEGSDFDVRLETVLKFRCEGNELYGNRFAQYPVDILVASRQFETVQQHINMNDFNINQFHISALGMLQDWEPTYIGLEPYGTLRQTRATQVAPSRTQRFIEYARSVNWEVDL